MSNVFVVEMLDIKLTITDAQQEVNSAERVMEQDILRLCVKLRRSKTVAEELEDNVDQSSEEGGGAPHHVRQVEAEDKQGDDCEYVFGISDDSNVSSDGKISVKIGGLPVTMIFDSGASCNVIGRNVWEYLKANKVECVSSKATKKLYSYGSRGGILRYISDGDVQSPFLGLKFAI